MVLLSILVGPSGAGKSTVAQHLKDEGAADVIISSDAFRAALWGDFQDQRHPPMVFMLFHRAIGECLYREMNVVADATHIRLEDFKKTFFLANPKEVSIDVHFIDRPLEDKLHTKGWRPDSLIHKHHNQFIKSRQQIKDFLRSVQNEGLYDVRVMSTELPWGGDRDA